MEEAVTQERPLKVAITGATGRVGRLLVVAVAEGGISMPHNHNSDSFDQSRRRRNVELRLLYHSRDLEDKEAEEKEIHLPEEERARLRQERKKKRLPAMYPDRYSWEEEQAIGLAMELEDCYLPLLAGTTFFSSSFILKHTL